MTRRPFAAATALLLGLLSIAAGPPVAMRVELEPAGTVEGDTLVSVTVQVAPEDRRRMGSDVWVQCELLQGGERVDRLARALDLDDRGQARFETGWPAGEYELRVEITGPERGARGFWAGRVTVPDVDGGAAEASPEPPEMPEPAQATDDVMIAAAAAPDSEPDGAPTDSMSAAAAQPELAQEPADEADDVAEEPHGDETAKSAAALAAATGAAAATAQRTEPPSTGDGSPAEAPTSAPPEPEPTAEAAAPVAAADAAETVRVEAALAATATTTSTWAQRSGSTADLTVVVTEQNRPILGLGPSAFELRVGRNDVALVAVGDASSAPLNLGIIVDLAAGSSDLAAEIAQRLGAFSLRSRSGGGLFLVTPARPAAEWGATADDIARTVGAGPQAGSVTLPTLLSNALMAFEGRRGRSFLLVLSDGADDSDKSSWKSAVSAAETAGVVVYAIGIRDSGFASRARSSLSKIANVSGGRSYFLGDAGMTAMTLDFLGELIDASYALPYPAHGGPADVKVELSNRGWDVSHPSRVP